MEASLNTLSIRDLTVTAPSGRVLLSVPRLDIDGGTRLGVRGPSGAGKSTLIFAIAGLADGANGSVIWGDTDILALPASARSAFRRKTMGIVFQDFHLFEELTAAENASVTALFTPRSKRAGVREQAGSALAQLGIKDPDQGVLTLSGGERQRVAVARALAQNPSILLADEPTANLQRQAASALGTDLMAGPQSLVVASHDEDLLQKLDRVLTLQDGEIVSDA
jgi:putative ABC transport system ATP-binding protein